MVQLYSELAAGFESMITDDLINSPPDRMVAGALAQQANAANAANPAESAQRSDTVSPPQQPNGPRSSRIPPDPPEDLAH